MCGVGGPPASGRELLSPREARAGGHDRSRGFSHRPLQAEVAEPRMIRRTRPLWPVKLAVGLLDQSIVDGGVPVMHQPILAELPVFIAVGTIPFAGFIVPFVSESNSDPALIEGPQLFDQAVVEFP